MITQKKLINKKIINKNNESLINRIKHKYLFNKI